MSRIGDNIELIDEDSSELFYNGIIIALPTIEIPWYSCDFDCEFLDGEKENLWLAEDEFVIEKE